MAVRAQGAEVKDLIGAAKGLVLNAPDTETGNGACLGVALPFRNPTHLAGEVVAAQNRGANTRWNPSSVSTGRRHAASHAG
jgi:hypothetical protein